MGAKVTASQDKTSADSQKNANTTTQTTFDPRADDVIANLSGGLAQNNTNNADLAGQFYKNQVLSGLNNPYAQQVVDSQDKLAQADFDKRLSGVRSSGYGGGIGRDLIDQGMFTSDFTNKQHAWNAQTLLDAFNTDQGRRMDSAGALANIDNAKYATAINFINSLRGQKTTADETAKSDSKTTSIGASVGGSI